MSCKNQKDCLILAYPLFLEAFLNNSHLRWHPQQTKMSTDYNVYPSFTLLCSHPHLHMIHACFFAHFFLCALKDRGCDHSSIKGTVESLSREDSSVPVRCYDLWSLILGPISRNPGKRFGPKEPNSSSVFKVIPEFCIAHSYCVRFLRLQQANMSARADET